MNGTRSTRATHVVERSSGKVIIKLLHQAKRAWPSTRTKLLDLSPMWCSRAIDQVSERQMKRTISDADHDDTQWIVRCSHDGVLGLIDVDHYHNDACTASSSVTDRSYARHLCSTTIATFTIGNDHQDMEGASLLDDSDRLLYQRCERRGARQSNGRRDLIVTMQHLQSNQQSINHEPTNQCELASVNRGVSAFTCRRASTPLGMYSTVDRDRTGTPTCWSLSRRLTNSDQAMNE